MAAGGVSRIQIIVQGGLTATRQLLGVKSAVQQVGQATNQASAAAEKYQRRSFLMNQALFTMRRYAYAATIALVALGGASLRMGFNFNIAMEQNQVAFEHFLGSAEAARTELSYLYDLAARTPFEFQQLAGATRRFMAFGFTLQETNRYMQIIGDTAAGLGGDTATNIERLVLVLGQVRATGRVLGQDMLQLQQLGINTTEIFEKQLGISRSAMRRGIGELNIPAEIAIPALMRGMDAQFRGMAAKQAQTVGGMLTTLHDYTAQVMGAVTTQGFERLRSTVLPSLISLTQELAAAGQRGTGFMGMMEIIDEKFGARGSLVRTVLILRNILVSAWNVLIYSIIPAFKIWYGVLNIALLPVLVDLTDVLVWLTRHSRILSFVLAYVALAFTIMAVRAALATIWTTRLGIATLLSSGLMWRMAIFTGFTIANFKTLYTRIIPPLIVWFSTLDFALIGATATTIAYMAAQAALNFVMYLFPGTWLVAGIYLVIGALVYLEIRFGIITEFVKTLWGWVKALGDKWTEVSDSIKNSWLGRTVGWIRNLPLGHGLIETFGGHTQTSLPEMLGISGGGGGGGGPVLAGAARLINPMYGTNMNIPQNALGPKEINLNAILRTDRKVLAQEVYSARLDTEARR